MTKFRLLVRSAILLCMLVCAGNGARLVASQAIPATIAASFQPMQVERNWWFSAPGGRYGLLELTTHSVWSEPAAKIRRTTLLAGPWHWTFDLSAPQFLMVTFVVVVGGLFATGWIRSQRFGR